MYHYSNSGPFMNPHVFRSTSHPVYHVDPDQYSSRYATAAAARSARRDDYRGDFQDRHLNEHTLLDHVYRSDHRYVDQPRSPNHDIDHLVRKTNQNVGVTNNSIDRVTQSTVVQPKVCMDGRYPSNFSTPMVLSDFMRLSESELDHLLRDYEVPYDGRTGYGARARRFDSTSTRERVLKMSVLLDFLGATQIAAILMASGSELSSSRRLLSETRR